MVVTGGAGGGLENVAFTPTGVAGGTGRAAFVDVDFRGGRGVGFRCGISCGAGAFDKLAFYFIRFCVGRKFREFRFAGVASTERGSGLVCEVTGCTESFLSAANGVGVAFFRAIGTEDAFAFQGTVESEKG